MQRTKFGERRLNGLDRSGNQPGQLVPPLVHEDSEDSQPVGRVTLKVGLSPLVEDNHSLLVEDCIIGLILRSITAVSEDDRSDGETRLGIEPLLSRKGTYEIG